MNEKTDARNIIEVYADVWCPFAHVGLKAAAAVRDQFGRQNVSLVMRAWPLELVNGHRSMPQRRQIIFVTYVSKSLPTSSRVLDKRHSQKHRFPPSVLPQPRTR